MDRADKIRAVWGRSRGAPRVAAITVVRDEAVMLPRWIAHYARACGGPEHLTVVDNQTSDGSTDDLPCRVVPMPDTDTFEHTRMHLVSDLARELLATYDGVVFSDADEFLVADPTRFDGFGELLAARPDAAALGAVAFNLVHHAATEPALDPDRLLLDQRRLGVFVPKLCKPALKRVPANWVRASHGLRAPYRIDPELWMFHAKFADRDHLRAVAHQRQQVSRELGRAIETSWSRSGDDLVALLDDITRDLDPAAVKIFRPTPARIGDLVETVGDLHITCGDFQEGSMRKRPVRAVPPRFVGSV